MENTLVSINDTLFNIEGLKELSGTLDKGIDLTYILDKIENLTTVPLDFDDNSQDDRYKYVDMIVKDALSQVDEVSSDWDKVASFIYLNDHIYKSALKHRGDSVIYEDYPAFVKFMLEKGLYSDKLFNKYSDDDLKTISSFIKPELDNKLKYEGLYSLVSRYLAVDYEGEILELPQERWLAIALTLMQDEKVDRLGKIKEAYWALSNLYMTVATPTLGRSGKPHGQLSSCFIDTVDDSLYGIYDSNTDIADLSKNGGGIGQQK